jgi:hypothetical protein
MKKLILLVLSLVSLSVFSQTDTTNNSPLDKLSYDELIKYYINEKEPPAYYKGPEVGDSVFKVLNPQVVPTQTVFAEPLLRVSSDFRSDGQSDADTASDIRMEALKPKVSLGVGRLGFYGDLYNKRFQSPMTARPAIDLNISQRLTSYLQLNFSVLFGKLGANEWLANRQENFQSEIRAGGLNLLYDFGNLLPPKYAVRPFVSFGVMGFEFLSKTDLKDKNGKTYYYWKDGSIKDKAEGSADAQFAENLKRDYVYETDIRQRNKDGFGKYQERAWSFPIGVGALMKVTERVDVKLNFQFFLTTTDYLDGITNKSIGERAGTKGKDRFTFSSIALQYDLIANPKTKAKKVNSEGKTMDDAFWAALDLQDNDHDGVTDWVDKCLGTSAGAKVDLNGCPLDGDQDGIPDYLDDELATAPGVPVNGKGVGQTDDYWKAWYANYLNDSTDMNMLTEYVGNFFAKSAPVKKQKKIKKDAFAVELARFKGAIPNSELASLLSIGDINSKTLADGSTVVYTIGNYEQISSAVKRRDQFRQEGRTGASISRLTDNDIVQVSEEELANLLKQEDIQNNPEIKNINVEVGDLTDADALFLKAAIVYRVQLGAFKNRISTSVFNTSAGVLELKTGESIFRYVTKGFRTISEAAAMRADLVIQGYSDAFVTAYKEGKRIALNETKATVDKAYKEDLDESLIFSSVDKKLVSFKVQLGPLKKPALEAMMDEKVKSLDKTEKQTTANGNIRYTSGNYTNFEEADKYRKELEGKGFSDAFIIATFKNQIISIQEALELMK